MVVCTQTKQQNDSSDDLFVHFHTKWHSEIMSINDQDQHHVTTGPFNTQGQINSLWLTQPNCITQYFSDVSFQTATASFLTLHSCQCKGVRER